MAKRAAIRNEGRNAEQRFMELVEGARPSDHQSRGDSMVLVDGEYAYVEVKECHAEAGCSGTINQVRSIKYICCVVSAPNHGCWYVIAPDQLVGIAASKGRGQHTEIPFECMNFSLLGLPSALHTKCDDSKLSSVVHEAIRRGRRRSDIASAMTELLRDINSLKNQYSSKINQLLRNPQGQ